MLLSLRAQVLVDDEVAAGAAEDEQVEQRIGAEPVGAVHGDARAFTYRIQAADDGIRIAVLRRHDLSVHVRRNAPHLVVDGRHDRNRFLDRIDVGELDRDFANRRQALDDHLGTEVVELQEHEVLLRTAAASFLDLLVHRARDDVARRQVLGIGRIPFHEALDRRC